MDLRRHYTHWNVRADLAAHSNDVARRFGVSWNSYYDHPPGMALDSTSVDYWHDEGRGKALAEHKGDAVVAWLLGQAVFRPIRWLIWWGWIWTPREGWRPYSGWQGPHKGPDAHVHVTYQ